MKFLNIKFKGYLKDSKSLPRNQLDTKYSRIENTDELNKIMEQIYIYAIPMAIVFIYFTALITYRMDIGFKDFMLMLLISFFLVPVHEILHAVAMPSKAKKYMYFFEQGMCITTTDIISRKRFIIMNLLPNIILGIIPFTIYVICDFCGYNLSPVFLGISTLEICYGIGDYWNVYNAINITVSDCMLFNSGVNTYYIGNRSRNKKIKLYMSFVATAITFLAEILFFIFGCEEINYIVALTFTMYYMINNKFSIFMRYIAAIIMIFNTLLH